MFERKDVLSGALGMSTLLAWRRYVTAPSHKQYAVVLLLFALALMCKPTVVMLPVILFAARPLAAKAISSLETACS